MDLYQQAVQQLVSSRSFRIVKVIFKVNLFFMVLFMGSVMTYGFYSMFLSVLEK